MATFVSRSFNVLSSVSHSVGGLSLTASGSKLRVGADAVATESFSTGAFDALGAASTAQTAAQSYADGLAVNYDAAGTAATLIAAAAASYDVAGAATAAVAAAASSYDVAGAAAAAVSAAASSYDVAGAATAAVAAAAVASVVNLALSADADLSSTPLSKSGGYWFVDGSTADRVVTLPGSANVPGCVMTFMNVGATNNLNLNTGIGILKSIAPGDGLKCVANGANWYFFSC